MANLLIFAGILLVWIPLAYAWWVKIRVLRLRQDLYDVRDRLFDIATEQHAFDDPAYRAAREHLNAAAAIASDLTVPLLIFLVSELDGYEAAPSRSSNPELQRAIDRVYHWSAERLSRYILRETLSGRLIHAAVRVFAVSAYLSSLSSHSIEQWLRSPGFCTGHA